MWPMLLDYTRDECQRMLRKLELEAYASVVSAFRAQGELTKDKKKMLQELSGILCISLERHRAEIRRAVNDERLNTIADRILGPNTGAEWAIEGRRLIPLMPRLVPQTAFSALANSAANIQAAKNAAMPPPSATGVNKDSPGNGSSSAVSPVPPGSPSTPTRIPTPTSVASTGVARVLGLGGSGCGPPGVKCPSPTATPAATPAGDPSGEDEHMQRKRKRSLSLDSSSSAAAATAPAAPPPQRASNGIARTGTGLGSSGTVPGVATKVVNLPMGPVPVRVTLAPQKTTITPPSAPKVILVSTGGTSSSGMLQPPLTVPVVKTVSAPGSTSAVHQGKAVLPGAGTREYAALTTSVTSVVTTPVPSPSVSGGEQGIVRAVRPRAVTVNPRMPLRLPRGVSSPLGGPQLPSPGGGGPSYGKATISVPKGAMMQYRPEGTVKIIAQSQLPISSGKLGSKPGGTMVTATSAGGPSTAPRVSTVSMTGTQARVVNVIATSQSGVVRTFGRSVGSQLSGISPRLGPGGTRPSGLGSSSHQGAKPNVIVVHKAQVWPQSQAGHASGLSSSLGTMHAGKSTEPLSYLQRQDRLKGMAGTSTVTVVKTSPSMSQQCNPLLRVNRNTVPRASCQPVRSSPDQEQSNLLADLIHAAGILPDSLADDVPHAEVEVAIDSVPLDDNALLLDEG
ncbi:unnamed protein product, partial [Ixodes pacificus]